VSIRAWAGTPHIKVKIKEKEKNDRNVCIISMPPVTRDDCLIKYHTGEKSQGICPWILV
jgi:hypothetical protein